MSIAVSYMHIISVCFIVETATIVFTVWCNAECGDVTVRCRYDFSHRLE